MSKTDDLPTALTDLMSSDLPTSGQIDRLEAELLKLEKVHGVMDFQTEEHHVPGFYGRSVYLPAGAVVVGLAHKAAHLNVCVGDITVWTEQGMKRLKGTHLVHSEAGARRVGFAHSDTVWMSIHDNPTGETDPNLLAAMLVHEPHKLLENRMHRAIDNDPALKVH